MWHDISHDDKTTNSCFIVMIHRVNKNDINIIYILLMQCNIWFLRCVQNHLSLDKWLRVECNVIDWALVGNKPKYKMLAWWITRMTMNVTHHVNKNDINYHLVSFSNAWQTLMHQTTRNHFSLDKWFLLLWTW